MLEIGRFLLNVRYSFRVHKPLLLPRLAKAVLSSHLLNRPPLRYVDFAIDFACNLHCEHCFAESLKQPGARRMTLDDYARVAKECMQLGTLNFSFQGGEPLLFKDLGAIISACRPERNVISVTTNGTLLNKDRIVALKRQGVDILTVSLDSAIAEEHDRFRGARGTFKKTMAGIELARRQGLQVTLGTVVTHQTLMTEGITGLVRFAQKRKLLLYFIMPVPAGRWEDNQEVLLTRDDLEYIEEITRSSRYLRTDFQANLGPYGCGAVKEILYLTPYGDVLACPFMHISLGNIFEESIATIRNRALQNPYFATYHQKCLVSTDHDFMEKYLSKTYGKKQLPLSWKYVFPAEGCK